MNGEQAKVSEAIQKLAAQVLATSPAGEGLCLIGGFRYRLLDASCRRSLDIDYHWPGDLEAKQIEVVKLFRKKLLPLVWTRMGFEGSVYPATGPENDSPAVRTVDAAFWKEVGALGRIIIPVDITRIPCDDKPIVRTMDGIVYLSASDADMTESKVVAILARQQPEERDMVDLFLFQERLPADAAGRVNRKLLKLKLSRACVGETLRKITADRDYHIRKLEGIVKDQIDPAVAANLRAAGGAATIFDQVWEILTVRLGLLEGA